MIISIVYTFLNRPENVEPDDLKAEGQMISIKLNTGDHPCTVLGDNRLDRDKLIECYNTTPEHWKQDMNVKSNFVIYIQDQDGHVISFANHTCFGDDGLEIDGFNCSQLIS